LAATKRSRGPRRWGAHQGFAEYALIAAVVAVVVIAAVQFLGFSGK
jgi:hypothetical protein